MRFFIFVLLFTFNAQAKDVNLKWRPMPTAKKYRLQVASEENFNKIIFETVTEKTKQVKDLKSGIYYLRVSAIDQGKKQGSWSRPFKLVVTAPVVPLEQSVVSQSVGLNKEKKFEPVKAQWETPEVAPKYLVKVLKDGKEVAQKQTSTPEINFKPQSPGFYEVKVSAAYDRYFGPAVTIKKFDVMNRPQASLPPKEVLSQKSAHFDWTPKPGIKKYKVILYKNNGRAPASEQKPYMIIETENPKAELGKLAPGQYVASVESIPAGPSPVTEYSFDVKKTKAIEFEKVDLAFHYNIKSVEYSNRVNEAGRSAFTKTLGGEFGFEGTMWFPNSSYGLRAEGNWGNLLIQNQLISFSELKFSGIYNWTIMREQFHSEIKPFLGARIWTMPVVLNDGPSSNNPNNMMVLAPTMAGPVLGVEFNHPFSRKWSLATKIQASVPLIKSSITSEGLNDPLNFSVNSKVEIGLKYAWRGNYRIFALAGVQDDNFNYNTTRGSQGQNSPGQTYVNISSITGSLGLEITDEGAEFSNLKNPSFEKFSEFTLTTKYSVAASSYKARLNEIFLSSGGGGGSSGSNPDPYFNGAFSGNFDLETKGYFPGSYHGLRMMAGWGGYTYQNTTVSYPEFYGQWARRFSKNHTSGLRFINYLGVRSWQVPIITTDTSPQGSSSFFSHNPQLLGLAETPQLSYGLGKSWEVRLQAEVSVPLMATNRDSVVDKVTINYLSYKADLSFIKSISNDISIGTSLGYKADRIQYIALGNSESTSSNAELSAPSFGLFGTYSF